MAFDKDEAVFVKDKHDYKGPDILSQFTFENLAFDVTDDMEWNKTLNGTVATVTVSLKRICWFYLYTMFIPSLCIVVTAELTLFVSEVKLNDNFL